MKRKTAKGLFDEDFRLERLTDLKDPLVKLDELVRWEDFRATIEIAFPSVDGSKGGRPPYDRVLMFKVLILQKMYGLSDAGIEYQITDRLSFMRFLGLGLSDKVVDEKTVWLFRNTLGQAGVIDELFNQLNGRLHAAGLILNEGKIVDAQIVQAPIQRNNRDENRQIKEGEKPEDWSEHKSRQKDTDARWTKKHGRNYFGYKNHIKMDAGSKLIENFQTSPANEHDSLYLVDLLEEGDKDQKLYADAAYQSNGHRKLLKKHRIKCHIHEKASAGRPLTDKQKQANRVRSRTRARVEHAFGHITSGMNGYGLRCVGLARATAHITLTNICYNLQRAVFLITSQKLEITL